MSRIMLTPEQTRALVQAAGPVEICDPDGKFLCQVGPVFTQEEIARALHAAKSNGPWIPAEQVHQALKTLQDVWNREGPFSRERAEQILKEIRSKSILRFTPRTAL